MIRVPVHLCRQRSSHLVLLIADLIAYPKGSKNFFAGDLFNCK